MQKYPVTTLREELTFTNDLMLDENFNLLPAGCPVTNELTAALRAWEFTEFYCDGTVDFNNNLLSTESRSANQFDEKNGEDKAKKEKIGQSVRQVIKNSLNSQIDGSDKSRMAMVQKVYEEYTNYIEEIFTHYATHKEIDQEEVADIVKDLCGFIRDNRRFILRMNNNVEVSGKNFLVIHTIRTTVLALAIAMQMHMPISKMIELGVSCIVHEIGMLRLPPQIYMTDKNLTPGERIQIYKHPIFGYTILKDLNFPMNIQLGVLEHHEKENGTGYPRRILGDKISSIAKIISVACSYEAITSSRNYRAERSNFDAILELLQNQNHPYDEGIIKALLYTVSLYPIGSYVYLSNRKAGIVIDTNPDNPKMPVVQMLTEKDKDGTPLVIQTAVSNIKILRIMSKREQEDLLKIIAQKENPDANGSGDNSGSQTAHAEGASRKEDSDATLDTLMEVVEPTEFIEPIPVEEAPIRPLAGKPAPKPAPTAKPSPAAGATGSAGAATGPAGANAANPKPAAKPNNSSGDDMETVDISFFN
ncbi:MAG: HD domain-containing protein [Treponema sp.]|nr:HD domain-containing protein [Treponema sp.]